MKTVIIDTNGYLRLFLDDNPDQVKQVEKLLQQAKEKKIVIRLPDIVVFELIFALDKYYGSTKQEIVENLRVLVFSEYILSDSRQNFTIAFDLYLKSSVSFVDCFLMAQSKSSGSELFTFDKKLKKEFENN